MTDLAEETCPFDIASSVQHPIAKEKKVKAPKEPKPKKRMSDFEITRTILQRTSDRKLQYLLKNMGEDPDILVLCSTSEKGFTYGSPDISVALIHITDPDLSNILTSFLEKIHGFLSKDPIQRIINIRDQISELAKTKGEAIETDVICNDEGSIWTTKTDTSGAVRTVYYCQSIDNLFNVEMVHRWCKDYRSLLTTQDPDHLYYPYHNLSNDTASIITLPPPCDPDHPIAKLYPHGFRMMGTKGFDIITDSQMETLPYPIEKEEIIVFSDQSAACKMVHRIIATGWQMILFRPNAVYFPTVETPLPFIGHHSL